jgi:hypothetical protein
MSSGKIDRRKVAAARVGLGITHFDANYVDKGGDPFVPGTDGQVLRVRPVPLGERAVGFFSDEIDRLIQQLREWRDGAPRVPPKPAVPAQFHPSRHRKGQKQSGRQMPTAR